VFYAHQGVINRFTEFVFPMFAKIDLEVMPCV
jgi:hypothetical protein